MNRLASMGLTFFTLIGMIIWLFIGRAMGNIQPYRDAITSMNDHLIRDWLLKSAFDEPLVFIWFAGICLWSLLLFINLATCLWLRLALPNISKLKSKRLALTVVHIVLGLVMIAHAGALVFGYKAENLKAVAGQKLNLGQGYELLVKKINFRNDINLLQLEKRQARRAMTRKVIDPKKNTVDVVFTHYGKVLAQGTCHILSPLSGPGGMVFLNKFSLKKKTGKLTAQLAVTGNNWAWVFFLLYGLFILSLIWLFVVGFKVNGQNYFENS